MLNDTKTLIENLIRSNFDIIDEFRFLDNDHDPKLFFEWCKKWNSYTFSHNQRIIIFNIDVDYYCEGQTIGNNTYNFFACCAYFQLPTEFFLYFTVGAVTEIFDVCKLFNLMLPTVLSTIGIQPTIYPTDTKETKFDSNLIQKPFVCLNKTKRTHRVVLLSHLKEHGLLDKGFVSYQFSSDLNKKAEKDRDTITKSIVSDNEIPIILRTTIPINRINDFLSLTPYHLEIFNKHQYFFSTQTKLADINSYQSNGDHQLKFDWHHQPNILKFALVYVVTETVFNYPYPWISEKTIKGFLAKRPMIIVSSPGTVKKLKELGFMTFESLWDEKYDSIVNNNDRMSKIVNLIIQISEMSTKELHKLAEKAQEIVEFNFNHYRNVKNINKQLAELQRIII
jgi:hypothetical protein